MIRVSLRCGGTGVGDNGVIGCVRAGTTKDDDVFLEMREGYSISRTTVALGTTIARFRLLRQRLQRRT